MWPLVVYFYEPVTSASYAAAAARLAALYPADHLVVWCSGAAAGRRATVADLPKGLKDAGPEAVLYLPAKTQPSTDLGRTDAHHIEGKGQAAPSWIGG